MQPGRPRACRPTLLAVALLGAAAACTSPAPTFEGEVHELLVERCAGCHQAGGGGPMPLTTWDEVEPWVQPIDAAVRAGRMPPGHADPACNEYANDRALREGERDLLHAWVEAGAPRGAPAPSPPAPRPPAALSRVDRVLGVQGHFLPTQRDEYRCFAMAWPDDAPLYLTGYDVVPGEPAIVHHVNLFVNPPSSRDRFLGAQEDDPEPGYRCSTAGRLVAGGGLIGAWAMGTEPVELPQASGILMEPGSVIVAEVHYHLPHPDAGAADQTTYLFQVSESVERRGLGGAFWDFLSWTKPGGMLIPAGESSVTHAFELDPVPFLGEVAPWFEGDRVLIQIVGLHMHYKGKSGRIYLRRPEESVCLLEIPRWDFNWQSGYVLSEPIELRRGDLLYLECEWDNSAENQLLVDGELAEPVDVEWGEGSEDEMCIAFLYVTEP